MYNDLYNLVPENWKYYIDEEDLQKVIEYLNNEHREICPKKELIFNALNYVDPDDVKVIILGLDPYSNNKSACGLSFAVPKGTTIQHSLRNIFKEICREYKSNETISTDLINWEKQGVLMINAYLTTVVKQTKAHAKIGWEIITKKLIERLMNRYNKFTILVSWGNDAFDIYKSISDSWFPNSTQTIYKNPEFKNCILLKSAHPSPLARGAFEGNNHFKLINEALRFNKLNEINWFD